MGRVGRYKDPCKRLAVGSNDYDLIDTAAESNLRVLLYKLITLVVPLKKNNEAVKNQQKMVLAKKEQKENQLNSKVNFLAKNSQQAQNKIIEPKQT